MSAAGSRRAFLETTFGGSLAAALAGLAGCDRTGAGASPGDATPEPAPGAGPEAGVGVEDIAAGEHLVGVEYSASERAQLVDSIGEQLALLAARRSFMPTPDLAPATVFDPGAVLGKGSPASTSSVEVAAGDPGPAPSDPADLAFAPVTTLSHWLRSGAITSIALTELYLDRLTRLGPRLNCVVTLTPELARAQARRADDELRSGAARGPLHGVPWGAKDLFDTAGIETSWGAATHRGRVPEGDASIVERLDQAGAVLVAKLSLGALAYGDIWFGGRTHNPWNPAEGSSGSSAGSAAATAAGLVPFAIGTETLGSIISPSMRTGSCGLRPSFGRVPRHGAMALCWSLDKVGPITRTVEDAALVLSVLNHHDGRDPASRALAFAYDGREHDRGSLAGLRLGYDPAWFSDDEGAIALDRQALETLRRLGAELVEVELEALPYAGLLPILLVEAAAAFEDLTLEDRDDLLTWQEPQAWPNTFRAARFIPAIDLIQAERLRRRVVTSFEGLLVREGLAALVSPSFAGPLLALTNFSGHPSLTLRVGFREVATRTLDDEHAPGDTSLHRVPHGITLWGRLYEEAPLLRIGRALEAALGVWSERPPGF